VGLIEARDDVTEVGFDTVDNAYALVSKSGAVELLAPSGAPVRAALPGAKHPVALVSCTSNQPAARFVASEEGAAERPNGALFDRRGDRIFSLEGRAVVDVGHG
jgi:hypothetical protein